MPISVCCIPGSLDHEPPMVAARRDLRRNRVGEDHTSEAGSAHRFGARGTEREGHSQHKNFAGVLLFKVPIGVHGIRYMPHNRLPILSHHGGDICGRTSI